MEEPPECPVCLQPFTTNSTIPRVLPCGHSVCESCLIALPKPPSFTCTVRCPACTQLVSLPENNPFLLPKNIDLLRVSSSSFDRKPEPKSKPKPIHSDFITSLWTREFYYKWKDHILPQDSIISNEDGDSFYNVGMHAKCLIKCQLFKVDCLMNKDVMFNYSYVSRVIKVLFEMSGGVLDEVEMVLKMSVNEYRVCNVYGLWCDIEDECLYVVFERKDTSLLDVMVDGKDDESGLASVAMIGMELCETVSRLCGVGLVMGCASLSCFGFDDFGHVSVDLREVLMVGGRVQTMVTEAVAFARDINDGKRLEMEWIDVFISPEVLIEFVQKESVELEFDSSVYVVGYNSDVWSLACILLWFLVGKSFVEETHDFICSYILMLINVNVSDCEGLYVTWLGKVSRLLDNRFGSDYLSMKELLHKCLCLDPGSRPHVNDLWKCFRELIIKPKFDAIGSKEQKPIYGSTFHCLLLGDLLWSSKRIPKVENKNDTVDDFKDENLDVEGDVIEGLCKSSLKCTDLKGHLDCISGLAIGGGFLFSSSFDKTVNVWSLQGLNHVHTFKGHEHKIMGVVFVDSEPPLCISADNGGDIFIWDIKLPLEEKPIKRLSEEKDWRYSGIHALAVSGSGYFYTGSGDKTIKAWSMHDYSLSCTMSGHKSVVSTLAVCNGVLYSGSWDGTIRLWCLSDHSPLAVLGEEAPSTSTYGSVLSLSAHSNTLVAAHENGCIKIWNNDVPLNPISAHASSIFSIYLEGQWLFSGGWNKTVVVQKVSDDESRLDVTEIGTISGDSVVTALLYWQGRLFVGQADRVIKAYSFVG